MFEQWTRSKHTNLYTNIARYIDAGLKKTVSTWKNKEAREEYSKTSETKKMRMIHGGRGRERGKKCSTSRFLQRYLFFNDEAYIEGRLATCNCPLTRNIYSTLNHKPFSKLAICFFFLANHHKEKAPHILSWMNMSPDMIATRNVSTYQEGFCGLCHIG